MENGERRKRIARASVIGISINLCIAAAKIIVGMAASSIAIISEGMNNLADAGSAVLTLVGTRLSGRHPDKKHPFGYGRIEYITSLTVSGLILYTGISLLINSVDALLHPGAMDVSIPAIVLVAGSAVVKYLLGVFVIKEGQSTQSTSLVAVGKEDRTDSFFSIVTIAAILLYMICGISADAIVGILFAVIIFKSGLETLLGTVSELIGKPGEEELAQQLYREIRSTDGILCAADMMLHNYGPDKWSGSVNIEVDHKENIGNIYEVIHNLQIRIMHEYNVVMVFGIYAVDEDNPATKEMRTYIEKFIESQNHLISYHALYQSRDSGKIYVDFVVDYDLQDWEELRREFFAYMDKKYRGTPVELTIETEYV